MVSHIITFNSGQCTKIEFVKFVMNVSFEHVRTPYTAHRSWIVRENTNFHGSETDFLWRKRIVCMEKKSAVPKKKKKKKEAPILVPHRILQNIWSTLLLPDLITL